MATPHKLETSMSHKYIRKTGLWYFLQYTRPCMHITPMFAHRLVDCLGTGGNAPFENISGSFPLIDFLLSFPPPPLPHPSLYSLLEYCSWRAQAMGAASMGAGGCWGAGGAYHAQTALKRGSWRPCCHNGGWPGRHLATVLLQPTPWN